MIITRYVSTTARASTLYTWRFLSTSRHLQADSPSESKTPSAVTTPIKEVALEQKDAREKFVKAQAPNRAVTWTRSQKPREQAMTGPRFEQTNLEYQPRPPAAIELINKQPIRYIDDRVARCDGGGGPRGHPVIFINVDKPGAHICGYCGLRFAATKHQHEDVLTTVNAG